MRKISIAILKIKLSAAELCNDVRMARGIINPLEIKRAATLRARIATLRTRA